MSKKEKYFVMDTEEGAVYDYETENSALKFINDWLKEGTASADDIENGIIILVKGVKQELRCIPLVEVRDE